MSKEKKEEKKNNKKAILLILLLLLFIGFGYAALSSVVGVNGITRLGIPKWNIYFKNVNEVTGSVDAVSPASISSNNQEVNFSVDLNIPGDYYEFTVDIVNEGSLDAKIDNIPTVSGISKEQDVYTNYTVTYSDGSTINKGDILEEGTKMSFRVRVEFDKDISSSDLPSVEQGLELSFPLTFVQR